MGATAAVAGGLGVDVIGQLLSSSNQSSANNQNFNYMVQHQQMLQDYANRMMQPGMNPFGQSMLNFVGQGLPSAVNSFNPASIGQPGAGGSSAGSGGGVSGGTGGNPAGGGNVGNQGGGSQIQPNYNMVQSPTGNTQFASQQGQPNVPGYTGGFTPAYGNIGGVDLSSYLGQGLTIQDLIGKGVITQGQWNQYIGNPAGFDPTTDPGQQQQYQDWVKGNQTIFQQTGQQPPSFQQWYNSFGQGATNIDAYTPNNPAALQQAFATLQAQAPPNGGSVNAQGQYVPPDTNPADAIYIQNGQVLDGSGHVLGPAPSSGAGGGQIQFVNGKLTYTAPQPGTGGTNAPGQPGGTPGSFGGQSGPTAYGQGSPMASYNQINPFTYSPSMLGQAPMVSQPSSIQPSQVNAPMAGIGSLFQGSQAQFSPGIQAQQVAATGTQALNAGQDALMQMMTKNLTPASDPSLNQNLSRLGAGADQYDTSSLFNAISNQSKQNLDQQVAQLQGSAGSLGQRFGTAMTNAESQLRQRSTTDLNAQEQQIGMQSFNNAQAMRQPALNLQADLLNQSNQVNQQNFGNQFQAASTLAGYGQQGASLNLQAALANASNALSAQSQNQNLGGQLAQFNAGNQQQAGLAGQSLLSQLSQFNAGQGFNASQQNAQLGLQGQQTNLQAMMQAALANQNVAAQYGTGNANIMNQAGQFNAGQGMSAAQYNSQQANLYNNLIMQAISQAGGMQSQQSGYNAGLLGILNSVSVPQVQPSSWGQAISGIGQTAALMPFLNQLYRPNNTAASQVPAGSAGSDFTF